MGLFKKKNLYFYIIALLIFLFSITFLVTAQPWNRCPFGEEDCPYPGDCGRYIDTNNDGICDLSQTKPVEGTDNQTQNDPGPTSSALIISANASEQQEIDGNPEQKKTINHYNLIEISLAIIFLYLGGKLLASKLKIRPAKERKFWNVLLLVSFIVSAGTGYVLILIRDFDWFCSINFNFLFWHVEFSIAMGLIGIFHALWHVKYYWKILTGKK
jgi:hypothetical protein